MRATDLNILALDTVTEACSAALYARGKVTMRSEVAANQHSRLAPGMVEEVLRAAGLELRDLDALAVDVGPGSFTGARIGIGLAQGLAYGANLPVIPVNSLEALAESARGDGGDGDGDGAAGNDGDGDAGDGDRDSTGDGVTLILPAIDARMQQVYFALYRGAEPIIEPALAAPAEVGPTVAATVTGARIIGLGSGWARHAAALQESLQNAGATSLSVTANRHPQAAAVARLAAARGLSHAVNPLHLRATYLRIEVAKPARAGQPSGKNS